MPGWKYHLVLTFENATHKNKTKLKLIPKQILFRGFCFRIPEDAGSRVSLFCLHLSVRFAASSAFQTQNFSGELKDSIASAG